LGIPLDRAGNLVAMTIEHVCEQTNLPSLSYEQIEKDALLPAKKPRLAAGNRN
jgi:hypothetical protein